ncbi:MAG: sigma-70 family RNA polymerase sigma factor [Oscillospiraceae bacterium]|jgi:RNA polymerase sporulation-specific sigma factor
MQEPQPGSGLAAESDERLAALSKQGSEEAMAILIVRYLGVVHKIAARFSAVGIEHEDFVQEGLVGFLSAVKTYRDTHNCSFNTYVRVCVLNRLKKAVSFARTNKYFVLSNAVDLDQAEDVLSGQKANPEKIVEDQETMRWFSKEIGELLSARERSVLLFYLEGYEPSQIAEKMHMAVKPVYNALSRVRVKLKRVLDANQNG